MGIAIPQIRPISDLRTNLNDVCEQAQESKEPIFMTKNGKASLVVIDCEAYEQMQQHERYVQKLREAEIEAKYRPDAIPQSEMDANMNDLFAHWDL
jgi:prevent-host-death family protein